MIFIAKENERRRAQLVNLARRDVIESEPCSYTSTVLTRISRDEIASHGNFESPVNPESLEQTHVVCSDVDARPLNRNRLGTWT